MVSHIQTCEELRKAPLFASLVFNLTTAVTPYEQHHKDLKVFFVPTITKKQDKPYQLTAIYIK